MSKAKLLKKGFGIAKRGVGKAVGGIRAAADKKKRPVRGSKNLTQPAPKPQRLKKPKKGASLEPEFFALGAITGGTAVHMSNKKTKKRKEKREKTRIGKTIKPKLAKK